MKIKDMFKDACESDKFRIDVFLEDDYAMLCFDAGTHGFGNSIDYSQIKKIISEVDKDPYTLSLIDSDSMGELTALLISGYMGDMEEDFTMQLVGGNFATDDEFTFEFIKQNPEAKSTIH